MKQQSSKRRVLIIDDEKSIRESLGGVLEDEGWAVTGVETGEKAMIEAKLNPPDLVFLDIWMPGMDGITVLQRLREINTEIPIVIMSGHATIDTAVRATRLGAFEVLEKPLELERIVSLLEQADVLAKKRLNETKNPAQIELIGESPAIVLIRKQIAIVGPKNAAVLITGENGVGKDVVARMIHQLSPRAAKPFIAINCAAIPEDLIEAELFGHVKGAFTNAVADRKGRFELAHGGTLFLDEIGEMSLKTQAKTLRILQDKVFERLGDHKSMHVDVRILAATNRDLPSAIKAGQFREDLFYRLNVIPIQVPPLRERRDDIGPLATYFVRELTPEGEHPPVITHDAISLLKSREWPGNVRELKNCLERLLILSGGRDICAADLATDLDVMAGEVSDLRSASKSLRDAKSDFERNYILGKLEECDWNVSRTADALNIERSNLHRKLKSYDIDPKKLKG
jgi:two-component system nitrogen regulation response regulator NtrX